VADQAVITLLGNNDPLKQEVNETADLFKGLGAEIAEAMKQATAEISQSVAATVSEAMAEMTAALEQSVQDSLGGVRDDIEDISDDIQDVAENMKGGWSGAMDAMAAIAKSGAAKIVLAFGVIGLILMAFEKIKNGIKEGFERIAATAKQIFENVRDVIVGVFTTVVNTINTIVTSVINVISTIASGIKAAFDKVAGLVKAAVGSIIDTAMTVLKSGLQQIPLFMADLATGLAEGFRGLAQQEQAMTRVAALVKATGGAAGFTADQLNEMAGAMQQVTIWGDDVILTAQGILLQFKNIRGAVFAEALEAAGDLAIGGMMDLTSAADKVGRALQNPIRAVRELRSEGINFTAAEAAMVEQLVKSGRIVEAQRIVLDKLAGSFKGAAAAAADTFSGKIAQLNNLLGDAWEEIANALVPIFEVFIPLIKKSAENTVELAKALRGWGEEVAKGLKDSLPMIEEWYNELMRGATEAFKWVAARAIDLYTVLQTVFENPKETWEILKMSAEEAFSQIKIFFLEIWESVFEQFLNLWDKVVLKMYEPLIELQAKFAALIASMGVRHAGGTPEEAKAAAKAAADAVRVGGRVEQQQTEEANKKRRAERDPEFQKEIEAERKRLEELRRRRREEQAPFDARFAKNREANQKIVDDFIEGVTSKIGLGKGGDAGRDGSDQPFVIENEGEGKSGAFEDLLALNKRIQSAAFKSPEVTAIQSLHGTAKMQHAEAVKTTKGIQDLADQTKAWATERREPTPGVYA
jgi:hypothetical protein